MAFNILVVDDSATMRIVVKKTVEMAGIPVGRFFEAAHGKEALEVLGNNWIDVLLSDLNMPLMGGMELLAEIKKNKDLERIPVIFITTEASDARMEEARRLGVAGYVTKPFQPEVIRNTLIRVLEEAYQHKVEAATQTMVQQKNDDLDF